ncbi:hypothetical protein H6P81_015242 [Aristolochia fimbriata]|uniref:Uncharacterized protein n=1 Tax=Aristolochia fimbriata TaxID=158543 RepID=A0AAV7E4X8_ARIFI|nr:hypothetical protein H6P81_015242 [Aristolochia fimbriata]
MERVVATAASRFAFRATATAVNATGPALKRLMGTTGRGANRAAVHGARMPAASSINLEEMEEELYKGKEEEEKKTKEVEDKVDSQLNKSAKKSSEKE